MKKYIVVIMAFILCIQGFACAEGFSTDPLAINEKIKSVVMLTTYDSNNQGIARGSGFVAFDNRTLVTNYHVIKDSSTIVAESDEGYTYFVTGILAADEEKDIAILQFMAPTVMLPLAYSTELPLRGSPIVVIGSPKGLRNTVSTGIVSSIYRESQTWVQFTAPASPGSSGGPVFDDSGKVIAMTTLGLTEGQNLNFAIGMDDILALYQSWDGKTVTGIGFDNKQPTEEQEKSASNDNVVNDATDKSEGTNNSGFLSKMAKEVEKVVDARIKVAWVDVKPGSKNDEVILSFQFTNPKSSKTIKAIELCIYCSDVWGDIVGRPAYKTLEKKIKKGKSGVGKFTVSTSDLNVSLDRARNFNYGISRIAYADGEVVAYDFDEIDFYVRGGNQ